MMKAVFPEVCLLRNQGPCPFTCEERPPEQRPPRSCVCLYTKTFLYFILYYYYYYYFIFDIFTPISTPSPLLARPPPMTQEAVHRVEDGPLPTGVSGRGGAVGLGSSEVSCTFTGGN
jgi:hypothetical protein